MSDPVTKIDNNTAHIIQLPPTKSFPKGIHLAPSFKMGDAVSTNSVPNKYLDELYAREIVTVDEDGKVAGKRFPGREQIEELQKPVRIYRHDAGMRISPQITVFSEGQAPGKNAVEMPHTLAGYSEATAAELVKRTHDKPLLKLWEKEARGDLKKLIQARLRGEVG